MYFFYSFVTGTFREEDDSNDALSKARRDAVCILNIVFLNRDGHIKWLAE